MVTSDNSHSVSLANDEARYSSGLNETQCIPTVKPHKARMSELRHVKFCDTVRIRETIHMQDYSDHEIQRSWYTKVELKKIKDDLYRTVFLMQRGEVEIDNDSECCRGLESRIGEKANRRKKIVSYAIRVVLWEQEQQSFHRVIDSFAIAQAYIPVSKLSAVIAHKIGLRDESDTHSYYSSHIQGTDKVKKRATHMNMRLTNGYQRRSNIYAWAIWKSKLSH
jgi:hypothetical protein